MGLNGDAIAKIQNYLRQASSLLLYQSILESEIGQAFVNLLMVLSEGPSLAASQGASPTTNHQLACHGAYGRWFSALANQQQSWQHHLITQMLLADNAFARRVSAPQCAQSAVGQSALPQGTSTSTYAASAPRASNGAAESAIAPAQGAVTAAQLADQLAPGIIQAVQHDLAIVHSLYHLPTTQLSDWVHQVCDTPAPPVMQPPSEPRLPVDFPYEPEWTHALQALATHYRTQGVGIFGQFLAFRWHYMRPAVGATPFAPAALGAAAFAPPALAQPSASSLAPSLAPSLGQLVGIAHPDPIRLSQLIGYDHPKQQLIQNTEFLLRGYRAQNVLLYGSRGAGKSSLVKALLTEYYDQGLRLVEVPKAHLANLPQIVEPLGQCAQKFIIFVDDLSFEEDDEAFKALKVVLEGGVTARPANVVVYATTNRRHLVREYFEERPRPKDADEIQAWDTVQEKLSFSDRFGLTLTFTPADQPTYLTIVRELVTQAGLALDAENLDWRARQWATRHNGRSGRTARQFVDFLIAEHGLEQS